MKLSKVLSIVVIAMMLLVSASNIILAASATIGGITINPNAGTADDGVVTLGNKVIGIVQTVGTVVAVLVIAVLGIKYMMGSAEEKAEYKKTLMPYIIGAVMVLAGVNIVKWIADGFAKVF